MRTTVYQLATGVGLVSATFFFGALILAFAIRVQTDTGWVRFAVPSWLWLGTAVLVLSSWMFEAARYALRRALVAVYRGRLVATMALAALFIGVQGAAGASLLAQGIGATGNPHASAFYAFTAIHAAHLVGGMGWLAYLLAASKKLRRATESDLRAHRRISAAAGMYWHFMGLVWLVMFGVLRQWTR